MGGTSERAAVILDAAHRQTYHEEDGRIVVRTTQDVEPHLEYCAKVRREERERRGRFGRRGDLHRTMSVPFNVIQAAAQRLGIPARNVFDTESQRRILQELKRPEFQAFRTTEDKRI